MHWFLFRIVLRVKRGKILRTCFCSVHVEANNGYRMAAPLFVEAICKARFGMHEHE